jgi:hypothetical protein
MERGLVPAVAARMIHYAARSAAPYVHPKLAALHRTHRGPEGGAVRVYHISERPMTEDEWKRERSGEFATSRAADAA